MGKTKITPLTFCKFVIWCFIKHHVNVSLTETFCFHCNCFVWCVFFQILLVIFSVSPDFSQMSRFDTSAPSAGNFSVATKVGHDQQTHYILLSLCLCFSSLSFSKLCCLLSLSIEYNVKVTHFCARLRLRAFIQ